MANTFEAKLLLGYTIITAYAPSPHMTVRPWPSQGPRPNSKCFKTVEDTLLEVKTLSATQALAKVKEEKFIERAAI